MLEHKEKLKNFFRDIVSEMITNLRNINIDDKIKIRKKYKNYNLLKHFSNTHYVNLGCFLNIKKNENK